MRGGQFTPERFGLQRRSTGGDQVGQGQSVRLLEMLLEQVEQQQVGSVLERIWQAAHQAGNHTT